MSQTMKNPNDMMCFDISAIELLVIVHAMTELKRSINQDIASAIESGKNHEDFIKETKIPIEVLHFMVSGDANTLMMRFAKTVEHSAIAENNR